MPIVLNNPHEYRGYAINEFTKLERSLDKHLLAKFAHAKNLSFQYEMSEIMIDRLTFESKRTAVKALLDKSEIVKGFIKTPNNSYPHGKLMDEVRQLIEKRNHFAHYISVIDHANTDSVITLLQYRDKTNLLVYNQEEFDSLIDRIRSTIKSLEDLIPSM